jgi:hypothetical protein
LTTIDLTQREMGLINLKTIHSKGNLVDTMLKEQLEGKENIDENRMDNQCCCIGFLAIWF